MALTVREIAERLGFAGPESARNWLRHARRLGLIQPVGWAPNPRNKMLCPLYNWADVVQARCRCQEIGAERRQASGNPSGLMSGPPSAEAVNHLLAVMEQVCRGETWPESGNGGGQARALQGTRRWRRFRESVA